MVLKKFADRLVSAGATAANALFPNNVAYDDALRHLESMGFHPERARHALNATNDVERAAELLLLGGANDDDDDGGGGGGGGGMNRRRWQRRPGNDENANDGGGGTHVAAHNDEQMRRAVEESMMSEESRRMREAEAASILEVIDSTGMGGVEKMPPRSAKATTGDTREDPSAIDDKNNRARKKAPIAPARRENPSRLVGGPTRHTNGTTLERTHPAAQIPEKLSNKSKEEQILRCANRLKSHVMAVDTLHRALTSVRNSPSEPKYRVIDRSNANYAKFVRDKPGAEDMLLAMNYRIDRAKDELRLERHLVDDALLYLGISSLEQARESEEYSMGKRSRAFHLEMRRVASGSGGAGAMRRIGMTESETSIRLAYMGKCPKEPPEGRGARIEVILGDESEEKIEGGRVVRRFDGDDTLEDVLNWIGGCYGNEILEKVRGESRVWCLCDLNNYPILPLDVERHGKKTLQYLGLFPSGKLGVRLSDDSWRDRTGGGREINNVHGSARGLGAASRSMLH